MLLQNLCLKSQAPAISSTLELTGMVREWGAEEPGTCSSVAQVDISSHEVSSPKPSPFFPRSWEPVAGTGGRERKETKHLPPTPEIVHALEFKGEEG